ncbi:hypothetical protein QR680_009282 [Steinernema hermaphroditum]|uniref:Tc1-like transposase DDE domain-containing protein n=1 Tax=Steinernema hermaphroditum TaxID=289476 RepID=A0AA39IJP9_9BILA|nr:hypothetical protein QR680_009282 [Steinernema hermaphroditum]
MRYLTKLQEIRNSGQYEIFYCDETWIYEGMTHRYDWIPRQSLAERQTMGLSFGPSAPSSKGKRAIVLHCIGRLGPVDGALDMFVSGMNTDEEYHRQMTAEYFERWIEKLLPLLVHAANGKKPCLVLDNAPYHGRILEKVPTQRWKKAELIEFLNHHCVVFSGSETRKELLAIAVSLLEGRRESFIKRYVDERCKEFGVELVRFNAIEFFWGWSKTELSKVITHNEKIAGIMAHAERIFSSVPTGSCEHFVNHVEDVENSFLDAHQSSLSQVEEREVTSDIEESSGSVISDE